MASRDRFDPVGIVVPRKIVVMIPAYDQHNRPLSGVSEEGIELLNM
jgi:hypothetical protein